MSVIVTVNDAKAAKLCSRGQRAWFIKNGLDWGAFLKQGLPEADILSVGDAMALKAVEAARIRFAKEVEDGRT